MLRKDVCKCSFCSGLLYKALLTEVIFSSNAKCIVTFSKCPSKLYFSRINNECKMRRLYQNNVSYEHLLDSLMLLFICVTSCRADNEGIMGMGTLFLCRCSAIFTACTDDEYEGGKKQYHVVMIFAITAAI